MESFIGQIMMVGFDFAPSGWALCNGQLLRVSQYTALFSLLGTQFGGDGQQTFGLPNLQGRVPIHMGQSLGIESYTIGQVGGNESVTLLPAQMPAHSHNFILHASDEGGRLDSPKGNFIASGDQIKFSDSSNVDMAQTVVSPSGGSQPHQNMQPYLVVNFIIALEGIFPSRS
jgi:microcystin-dependent protein